MPLPQDLRSGKWAWSAFPPILILKCLDSHQQLPKFPRTGNRDEGQLRKSELKLFEVVAGTVFRHLFYGIVLPKALLSFGSSSLFFPRRGSIAISVCMCMKTA